MGKPGKEQRRAAVEAELRRRVAETGVPEDKHLYLMCMHHGDEGGPRTFYPSLLLDAPEEQSKEAEAQTMEAIRKGLPIEVRAERRELFGWGAGAADISQVYAPRVHLLSKKAADGLRSYLSPCGKFFPLQCEEREMEGFILEACDEVLDIPNCTSGWGKAREYNSRITVYAFQTALLGVHSMFRVPMQREIWVLKSFVDAYCRLGLTGAKFCMVWPQTSASNPAWDRKGWVGADIVRRKTRDMGEGATG